MLQDELAALTSESDIPQTPDSTVGDTRKSVGGEHQLNLLKDRLKNYEAAEGNAKNTGDVSKARRWVMLSKLLCIISHSQFPHSH